MSSYRVGQHKSRTQLTPDYRSSGGQRPVSQPQGRGLTTLCLTLQGQDPGSRLLLELEYLALSPPWFPPPPCSWVPALLTTALWGWDAQCLGSLDARPSGTTLYSPASASSPLRLAVFPPVWASASFTAGACLARSLAYTWLSLEGKTWSSFLMISLSFMFYSKRQPLSLKTDPVLGLTS